MFKGHPKGLYALALANTGERFGYYTMLAIFVLFLQAKFGFNEAQSGQIYGIFLGCVYFMTLIGGILADRFGYGKMVRAGIVVMFLGYLLLAFPMFGTTAKITMFSALALIAIGTGLFKGNLQVMVGNLYDEAKYSPFRDNGFSLFYMAINIGSMFAPMTATKVTDLFLDKAGFTYVPQIPSLAHQYLDGTISADALQSFEALAAQQGNTGNLADFAQKYIDSLSTAYNYGFGVACISLVLSMAIYICCRKWFKHADVNTKQAKEMTNTSVKVVELTPEQTRSRMTALFMVFAVVIFFWMSFQQSGLCLTFFARDYTASTATGFSRIGFNIWALTLVAISVYTLFSTFQSETTKNKIISGIITLLLWGGAVALYLGMPETISILPQEFQQFNPFFVVALTPVSMAVFGALARKGKEPSSPKKIGLGMVVAALGFSIMAMASVHLLSPAELKETSNGISSTLVSPNWLISTYLVLTFAELLLSPIGISFVTKVAPPKYKGMMMGCWFCVTAIGNYLTSVIAKIWGTGMPLWMVWGVLVVLCLLSAIFIFAIMKKLEAATKEC